MAEDYASNYLLQVFLSQHGGLIYDQCHRVNKAHPEAPARNIEKMYQVAYSLLTFTQSLTTRRHHNLCYGLDIEAHPDCELCKLIKIERELTKVLADIKKEV